MFYIFFYVHLEYKLLTLGAPLHSVQHIGFGHRRAADQILAGTINFIIPLVGSPEVNPLAVMLLDNRLYIYAIVPYSSKFLNKCMLFQLKGV